VILSYRGDHQSCIKYCDEAIELDSSQAMFCYGKGIALSNLGTIDEAIKSFDKAI
jgi:tetratricopeptide (TPR) repeat protein